MKIQLATLLILASWAAPLTAQTLDDFGQPIDTIEEISIESPNPVSWGPPPFAVVRAYLYGLKGEVDAPVYHDGKLDKSVANKKGILLSPAQVLTLLDAISPPNFKDLEDPNMCYLPHHGFVFYDAAGKAVAQFSPCLICGTMEITPETKGLTPSYKALKALIVELEMPVFGSFSDAKSHRK